MAALEVETSLAEKGLEGLGLGRYNEFPLVELTYVAIYLFVALGDIFGRSTCQPRVFCMYTARTFRCAFRQRAPH